jgi:hypothetical protein
MLLISILTQRAFKTLSSHLKEQKLAIVLLGSIKEHFSTSALHAIFVLSSVLKARNVASAVFSAQNFLRGADG